MDFVLTKKTLSGDSSLSKSTPLQGTVSANLLRGTALFIILFQFRLLGGELADTSVYLAALLAGFGLPAFLLRRKLPGGFWGAVSVLAVVALVPWLARAFLAMPRLFLPGRTDGPAVAADALLLGFDRNAFVWLPAFYWAAASTWFCLRSRRALRGFVVADLALLAGIFFLSPLAGLDAYRWPALLILTVSTVVFLQALALVFSLPRSTGLLAGEKIAACSLILALVVLGGLLFLRPAQQRATERGGGLLEPRGLFSFDFAQILSLSPEIGMTDELLMIVRQSPPEPGALLRRSVMSGYDRRQGFFRIADLDERTQPAKVPNRPTDLARPEADSPGRNVDQEFFIVNFETNALLGRKRPVRVVPLETWDNASFRAAYTVESRVVDFGMTELIMSDAVSGLIPGEELGREDFGLGEREWEVYTDYGDDPRIRELALELTDGSESLYEKVLDIYGYLKFGDFRYSLRPGISGDGDQLAYFLFDARRGYCTYFAFSMTLMLRSLGIPARVAAGFFADPDSAVFDYHAIRADMAHAWVEVLFPGQDWVEFDPTTANLAEDEEFNFSSGTDPDLLERLMREILENRGNLRARFGAEEAESVNPAAALARAGIAALRKLALPIGIACLALLFLAIRCGPFMESRFRKAGRAKALALYRHALRRMRLAGLGCPGRRPQSEWAAGTEARIPGIYGLYLAASAARFAPTYAEEDFLALQADYGRFGLSYAKAVSPGRRLLAWLLPPLALILPAKSPLLPPLLALVLICLTASGSGKAQETPEEGVPRDAVGLFRDALSAEYAENWDRAITLYKEGSASFPDDVRFPLALGNLYYRKSLYGLAWDEFSRTLAIDPFHAGALQSKANTAGLLNRDREAVILLRRLLEIEPENLQAISNLGWMYFKVHRLTDGERLLVAAIEQFGVNQDLAMALGTVYSEMFRYEESRYWYRTAIDLSASSRSFLAVAHYNLSILESRFYRYDLALREANASLTAMRRSSGFLVRGELLMRQMDLSGATADFASAQDVDTTPLSRLSLATLHLASGRLTEALLYAESALRAADTSWMANYGISPDRYYADVHDTLTEIHAALAEAGRFLPNRTFKDRFDRGLARLRHRFYASVHRHLAGKYALAVSRAYDRVAAASLSDPDARPDAEDQVPPISRFLQLFGAFKPYPNRAVLYLNRARHFETAIIPTAASAYDLERAMLGTETSGALAALEGFDPIWQRDLAASAYGHLALHGRTAASRRAFTEELFSLNRGALPQAGLALPTTVEIAFAGGGSNRRAAGTLEKALRNAGFARPATRGTQARFRLELTLAPESGGRHAVSAVLGDRETGETAFSGRFVLPSFSGSDLYGLAGNVAGAVFRGD